MNILTVNNKIKAFKKKLQHQAGLLESKKLDMFSKLNDFLEENKLSRSIVKQSIFNHLQDLTQWFDKYFPEDTDLQKYIVLDVFARLWNYHFFDFKKVF